MFATTIGAGHNQGLKLKELVAFKGLKTLDLTETDTAETGVKEPQEALPGCKAFADEAGEHTPGSCPRRETTVSARLAKSTTGNVSNGAPRPSAGTVDHSRVLPALPAGAGAARLTSLWYG
jgi:hypothetical protein